MAKLIVLAGPQSSGKTTALNLLKEKYPNLTFLPEINPFTFQKNHLGGAFADTDMQKRITNTDLERTAGFVAKDGTYVVETGIFSLVYFERVFGAKKAEKQLKKYLTLYKKLNPTIIFIDTKPKFSWQRRKPYYLGRVKIAAKDLKTQKEMMKTYKQMIFSNYLLWIKYLDLLPYNKIVIKNSFKTYEEFKKNLMQAVVVK